MKHRSSQYPLHARKGLTNFRHVRTTHAARYADTAVEPWPKSCLHTVQSTTTGLIRATGNRPEGVDFRVLRALPARAASKALTPTCRPRSASGGDTAAATPADPTPSIPSPPAPECQRRFTDVSRSTKATQSPTRDRGPAPHNHPLGATSPRPYASGVLAVPEVRKSMAHGVTTFSTKPSRGEATARQALRLRPRQPGD